MSEKFQIQPNKVPSIGQIKIQNFDEEDTYIPKFAIKTLKLKGCELNVYSKIFISYPNYFDKTLIELSEDAGYCKREIISALKQLVKKDLIIKKEIFIYYIKRCLYKVNLDKIPEEVLNMWGIK